MSTTVLLGLMSFEKIGGKWIFWGASDFSNLWILFFWKRGQLLIGPRCSVLNGESVDVPEDIVVDWSLRYPRSATATPRKPFSAMSQLSHDKKYYCTNAVMYVL